MVERNMCNAVALPLAAGELRLAGPELFGFSVPGRAPETSGPRRQALLSEKHGLRRPG